jgi:hypothetical protein
MDERNLADALDDSQERLDGPSIWDDGYTRGTTQCGAAKFNPALGELDEIPDEFASW